MSAPPWLAPPANAQEEKRVTHCELSEYRPGLRRFVRHFGQASVNHVYIARADNDDGKQSWYAYWKEDQSILLLGHFTRVNSLLDLLWLHHKARIDLKTGVVPTRADVGSSTYLVSSEWANRIIDTCLKNGLVVKIRLKKAGR
jgi:hypothetical protein